MTELNAEMAEEFALVSEFLATLRESTDIFIPLPQYRYGLLDFNLWSHDLPMEAYTLSQEARNALVVERFRALAKAIGGRWEKNDPNKGSFDDSYYTFTSVNRIGTAQVRLCMDRNMICERVQVGTETVTIPAVEAEPERVVEKPIFERECKPLFANAEKELDEAMKGLTQ